MESEDSASPPPVETDTPLDAPYITAIPPMFIDQETFSSVSATPMATDQETGSKKPTSWSDKASLTTAELFDLALFIVEPSATKRTGSEPAGGVLNSPPKIGFPSHPYSWAEPKSSGSNREKLESKWARLFDALKSKQVGPEVSVSASLSETKANINRDKEVEPSINKDRKVESSINKDRKVESSINTDKEVESSINKDKEVESNINKDKKVESGAKNPPLTGAGLKNLGQTCYVNAVLQCLMHTVPFLQGILSDTCSLLCNCDSGGFCLLCCLRELIKSSFTSTDGKLSPLTLVNNLSYFSPVFRRDQQEDAHEFLSCFFSGLDICNAPQPSANFVQRVFGGGLVSKLTCHKCGRRSNTYEASLDLSLEIENADNLVKALQSFTMAEKTEGPDSSYKCEVCKERVPFEKQLALTELPPIATFQLKRFKIDSGMANKIHKHVAFPLELDLHPFTVTGETDNVKIKYELYAIVVHDGATLHSGHYYSFIRLAPNMWFKFDDLTVMRRHSYDPSFYIGKVSLVDENVVLSQKAYILFYAKEGTGWFSDFIGTLESGSATPSKLHRVDINLDKESGPRDNKLEGNERRDSVFEGDLDLSDVPLSDEGEAEVSLSLVEKDSLRGEMVAVGKDQKENLPAHSDDNLSLVDRTSRKRKPADDTKTIEACSSPGKRIPASTGDKLLAAPGGSRSEDYPTRKES